MRTATNAEFLCIQQPHAGRRRPHAAGGLTLSGGRDIGKQPSAASRTGRTTSGAPSRWRCPQQRQLRFPHQRLSEVGVPAYRPPSTRGCTCRKSPLHREIFWEHTQGSRRIALFFRVGPLRGTRVEPHSEAAACWPPPRPRHADH